MRQTGAEHRREFAISFQQTDRKDQCHDRKDRVGCVKYRQQKRTVIVDEHSQKAAFAATLRDQIFHIREGMEHDKDARETAKADHERSDKGSQKISIDLRKHRRFVRE